MVTHGGSARAAIGSMLGLPADHWGILGGAVELRMVCVGGDGRRKRASSTASLADVLTGPPREVSGRARSATVAARRIQRPDVAGRGSVRRPLGRPIVRQVSLARDVRQQ